MSDLRSAVEALLHTARHPREVYRGLGLERIAEVDANALDALRAALASPPAPAEGEREGPTGFVAGWRAGVLAARDYLRWMWDDGDQGNANDAAELTLLTGLAEKGQRPASSRPPSSPDPARCERCGGAMVGISGFSVYPCPDCTCRAARNDALEEARKIIALWHGHIADEIQRLIQPTVEADGHVAECGNGGEDPEDCSPACVAARLDSQPDLESEARAFFREYGIEPEVAIAHMRAMRLLPDRVPAPSPDPGERTCSTCAHGNKRPESEPCSSCLDAWFQDSNVAPGWAPAPPTDETKEPSP